MAGGQASCLGRDGRLYQCRLILEFFRLRGGCCSRIGSKPQNGQICQSGSKSLIFPIAVETQGPLNEEARQLLCDLGRRILASSGDDREENFLFQRVSVVVQRFNSVLLHDSFSVMCQPD